MKSNNIPDLLAYFSTYYLYRLLCLRVQHAVQQINQQQLDWVVQKIELYNRTVCNEENRRV